MMNSELIIKAISNKSRWQILQWLKQPKKHFRKQKTDIDTYGVCSGLIHEKLGLSQSTTSHYMKLLEQSQLVTSMRSGQWTFYKRNETIINQFKKHINDKL